MTLGYSNNVCLEQEARPSKLCIVLCRWSLSACLAWPAPRQALNGHGRMGISRRAVGCSIQLLMHHGSIHVQLAIHGF